MKINIAIMEDEQIYSDLINKYLRKWALETNNFIEISIYANCDDFLSEWRTKKSFDIIFFDIIIKGSEIGGMDVANIVRENNDDSFIIFTTSVKELMQDGYIVDAMRYLIKPIYFDDIKECMDKILVRLCTKKNSRFRIKYKNEITRIPYNDITYFSSARHYVETHTANSVYKHMQKFNSLLKELPPEFCQCHRGVAVNLEAIYAIDRSNIILINHEKLPISESYLKSVKDLYMLYYG